MQETKDEEFSGDINQSRLIRRSYTNYFLKLSENIVRTVKNFAYRKVLPNDTLFSFSQLHKYQYRG